MNVNDEVIINAVIIGMTESGNPIIKTPAGVKMLIKASDVVTVRPPQLRHLRKRREARRNEYDWV